MEKQCVFYFFCFFIKKSAFPVDKEKKLCYNEPGLIEVRRAISTVLILRASGDGKGADAEGLVLLQGQGSGCADNIRMTVVFTECYQ